MVTLDGPAASGKSSVARRVAEELRIPFVSSGLLYRAATYLVRRRGIDIDDEREIAGLLERLQVELLPRLSSENRVLIEGCDVTDELHTDDVDACVSAVSRHPKVRAWVYHRLREIKRPFVIEGRDMGTAVFPDATHKFYLTAPAEVRAARRVAERQGDLKAVTALLKLRDRLDAKQLEPAADAVHVDTTEIGIEEVTRHVLEAVRVGA